jgi:hypothetical protein
MMNQTMKILFTPLLLLLLYRPRLIGQAFDHQAAVPKQKFFRASTGV